MPHAFLMLAQYDFCYPATNIICESTLHGSHHYYVDLEKLQALSN